ncbi:MAG: hypothetical protein RBG13Loki_4387 [Promethearchaeota archaeon CR_4]|nr:MAG: hypothetical protein RBG13Loki_4387 [Candidatus Lokiarchaeota archaeon CR_4]
MLVAVRSRQGHPILRGSGRARRGRVRQCHAHETRHEPELRAEVPARRPPARGGRPPRPVRCHHPAQNDPAANARPGRGHQRKLRARCRGRRRKSQHALPVQRRETHHQEYVRGVRAQRGRTHRGRNVRLRATHGQQPQLDAVDRRQGVLGVGNRH